MHGNIDSYVREPSPKIGDTGLPDAIECPNDSTHTARLFGDIYHCFRCERIRIQENGGSHTEYSFVFSDKDKLLLLRKKLV